jgi:hypothetical protein
MGAEFVALRAFGPPGSMVNGYQRGDRVAADVVERWGLVVGEEGHVMPLRSDASPRPADDDEDRAAWEAYALAQGWSDGDAKAASLDDLRAIPEPEPDEHGNPAPAEQLPDPTAAPVRPDDGAVKADWVSYVVRSGGDEEWATAKATTKADLQAWAPTPAEAPDPVAASATEQANG